MHRLEETRKHTVDFVLLGTKDGGQVISHDDKVQGCIMRQETNLRIVRMVGCFGERVATALRLKSRRFRYPAVRLLTSSKSYVGPFIRSHHGPHTTARTQQ